MNTVFVRRPQPPIALLLASSLALSSCATLKGKLGGLTPEAAAVTADVPVSPATSSSLSADGSGQQKWVEAAPEDLPRTDWVAEFSDAELTRLVDQALASNTDIQISAARYRAALARLDISEADLLPSVNGSSNVSRSENIGNAFDRTSLGGGVNASWEYDLWGRIRDGVASSELEAAASLADYAGVRLAIAAQVTQTWFDLIEARLLSELSVREVDTLVRSLRLTTRRFEGGVVGSSDVRLARSSLADAQALQASRAQRQSVLARSLEILLREYPDQSLVAAAELPVLAPLSGTGGPAYVLRHRPDVLAAERRMHAAGLDVDAARKALLPSLSFNGGLNLGGTALNNIFDIDALIADIAGGLTAPIFQGGRLKANVAQQEAILRQQLESYAGTALDAYLEVENALDADRRLAEREAALRVSLEEASKAEERLELRYTEGLATILQLHDSQLRRFSAESQLISARKERLANRVRLHVALGGGDITQNTFTGALSTAP